VDSPDGCPPVVKPLVFVIGNKIPLIKTTHAVTMCDDNLDGTKIIDLMPYISQFTTDPSVTVTFHPTLPDAQNNTAQIVNPMNLSGLRRFL
jgi:hypothetical protein